MEDRALIWMALALLALMLLAQIAYNLVIYVPHTVYPTPGPMPKFTAPNSNTTIVFNPIPYYGLLPTVINSSALASLNISRIFISNGTGAPILQNIVKILAMNASEVTPTAYFAVADLGGFYVNYKLVRTVNYTIAPFPMNANGTEPNMTKAALILQYYNFSPYNVSYPPSDIVKVGALTNEIINETTVKTSVQAFVLGNGPPQYLYSYTVPAGNNVYYVYNCYSEMYYGIAYLYANGKIIDVLQWDYTFYPYDFHSWTLTGYVTVPPGAQKLVQGSFTAITTPYSVYQGSYTQNNITYYVYNIYPSTPSISMQGYSYTWYEYNVTVRVEINVLNGTNPITVIENQAFTGRTISTSFWYTVWSSDPQSFVSDKIETYDAIDFGNFTIKRTWDAGYLEIVPNLNKEVNGNTVNYYLTFTVYSFFTEPPAWVFNNTRDLVYKHNFANDYGQLAYYYALYKFLYDLVKHNTTKQYYSYINWEVDVLANEIALQMKLTNDSYAHSVNPYLSALFNRSGNQTLIALQPVLIMAWGTYYHAFNGTYNVKAENWTYSMIIVDIPEYILNATPYIVLENSSTNVTAYLTDPTNIEHSFTVFWWYTKNETMYTNLPEDGQAVTFYEWYPYNVDNVPIYFETLNQTFTVVYYNSTVYNYTKQP